MREVHKLVGADDIPGTVEQVISASDALIMLNIVCTIYYDSSHFMPTLTFRKGWHRSEAPI